ncbi:MAG: peptidoglycan-associated lipoprotein Pal [Desulfonatronovibrionaceae bacterium]
MSRNLFPWLIILVTALVLSTGCAKKTVAPPSGSETEISAEEQARIAEEKRQEEMKHQAMEERRLQEERKAREQARDEDSRKQEQREVIDDILASTIYFDFDSYELKPDARSDLKKISRHLKEHDDLRLVIEGHTDERGTAEYNLALGERRARAAYEFLILLGVDSTRMQIISYGEERPEDPASTESAWALNRRAEFKILQ